MSLLKENQQSRIKHCAFVKKAELLGFLKTNNSALFLLYKTF